MPNTKSERNFYANKKKNKNQSINIGLRKKNKIIEKLPNVNREMQK